MVKLEAPAQNPDSWPERYRDLDDLIMAGKHDDCRKLLSTVRPNKIPRLWAYRFGELAFKIHFHLYGLKVLHRFVYPENSLEKPATDKEKMVYASALFSLGSVDESIRILGQIDTHKEPEALFYRALAGFYNWNYPESIPYLKRFIDSNSISPYRRLLGKINLTAAHIYMQEWSIADALLDEIQVECEAAAYESFLGYCYELRAQIRIFHGDYDNALILLNQAMRCLEKQGGLYLLFVEKWIVIASCLKSCASEDLARLRSVRSRAHQAKHWDTVRECDLFESIVTRDETLFRNVIMGTPSEHYRYRARKLFGESVKSIGQHRLLLGPQDAPSSDAPPVFDPYGEKLFKKPQLFKTFEALTIDFYKPCTLGVLFQRIFDGEVFNPFSSPPRVLQLLKRLDSWFIDGKFPVRVVLQKSEFSLTSRSVVHIIVQRGKKRSAADGKFTELKNHFAQRTFSTAQVAKAMEVSKFSAQQIVNAAIKEGTIKKEGQGRGTTYKFTTRRRSLPEAA